MKNRKTEGKKTNRHKKVLFALAVVFITLLCLLILEKIQAIDLIKLPNNSSEETQKNYDDNPPTQEQIDAGNKIKEDSSDQESNDLSVMISSIVNDGSYLHIRSIINGVISNSGSCQLQITDTNGNTVKETSGTFAMPSYSTCKGFDIDRNNLNYGQLIITLSVDIDNKTANAESSYDLE